MANWQTFDAGLPNVIVNELEIQYSSGRLRAATYGRGLWESDLFNGQLQATAYCAPSMAIGCATDYINNFSFNTLINNNSGCNGQPNGYTTYYPAGNLTTTVKQGVSYPISMQSGPTYVQGFGVWIDYNDDKDFDDSGEFVYGSPSYGTGVYAGTVTIPASVSSGLRRMRVRSNYVSILSVPPCLVTIILGEKQKIIRLAIGYCVPVYSVLCTSGDYIKNFSFNTLVNNNSDCNNQLFNYINYTPSGTKTTTVTKDKVIPSACSQVRLRQGFGVWIDYNNDQDFNDADEFMYSSPTAGTGVYNGTVTIPASVSTGQKRIEGTSQFEYMLLQVARYVNPFTWGETEDYTITIADPVVASSQWNKRFGGSGADLLSMLIKTSDGGYLLGGHSTSGLSGDRSQASQGAQDYWVVKTDASGNKQWDKRFGGQQC